MSHYSSVVVATLFSAIGRSLLPVTVTDAVPTAVVPLVSRMVYVKVSTRVAPTAKPCSVAD